MTAALNRATEALNRAQDVDGPEGMTLAEMAAHIVLSAALTDPDDPDWLAGVIARQQNVPFVGARQRRIAAAVRAAILGDAS